MNRPFPLAVLTSVSTTPAYNTVGTDLFSTNGKSVVQCTITGTGAGPVTTILEGSLDGVGWVPLITFSQNAASVPVSEGAYFDFLWFFIRVRVAQLPANAVVNVHIYREE